ncbi:FMN reductase [Micromonospora okii]|uniref:FMN reductase n=1 Tax=Micromonospora okii TaxID=1182970 RepID=UPI001E2F239A|nr:FMN reductase [Micromonospora okii]
MSRRTLAVVSAGLGRPSTTRLLADQLAAATRDELAGQGVEVDLRPVELRDHAHDVVNNLLTGFPSATLREALDVVSGADGVVAVTPIFNASYNGLFKSFFDVLDSGALAGRPVLIAATGGTARHSLALEHAVRPMFAYLRAVVVPTAVFAAPEDWSGGSAEGALRARIVRAAGELADQVRPRPAAAPPDPFALTTSFDELLAGRDPA